MSYQPKNLSLLAYANGFTLWHYTTTTDTADEVEATGYFNAAADMLREGDVVMANTVDGFTQLYVSSNHGGVIETVLVASAQKQRTRI